MDVSRLDLRIGRIVGVRYHPLAGALYVQEVDLGEPAPRTVVSALRHIPKEQLQGRLAVLLCNVRPCRVKGVVSTAMVLCGSAPNVHDSDNDDDAQVEFLEPPTNAVPGDRVTFYDYPGEPDRELSPREKVWEQILPDLQTDSRGVATYRGVGFEVRGKGLCRTPTLTNSSIK
ncbi:aminoacyl tRNA synthase complex-interacting multifunctional protein 1 [Oncorhynchus kisutch]|nr:aminoacyl tRNA synthase complex-interacting multifunctional protein 1 [Oncorhynchus kisutch]XP_031647442.1 aminoacyl tRNA synthase complex-interacting multifunctional protein 1 [Oncorhynchus kisutch]